MNITQFLKEDNGNYSSARLFAFLVVLAFCADYANHIWRFVQFDPSLTIVGVVLGAIGMKVAQKFGEQEPKQ
jgi:hypothetical protein